MSTILDAEIAAPTKPDSRIDGLRFRLARSEDAAQCAPLIYTSGEREFDYFLGLPSESCIAFLEAAFRSSSGRFSWRRHYVAVDAGGGVLAVLAAHDGRAILWDDPHIAWALMRFFGPRRAIRMLLRGLVLESELPKPARNETLLAHCATVAAARSRGVFSALFSHAFDHGAFELEAGRQLVLDVLVNNGAASALYERLGFVATARRREPSGRLPAALLSTRMFLAANPRPSGDR
jgi:ribosomal protein S18 acetylase RimI-like enzyme